MDDTPADEGSGRDPSSARRAGTVVVVVGGDPTVPPRVADVPVGATVIAADSGLDLAHALGWRPDLLVGDLDSVSPAGLDQARQEGIAIEVHPADKDATDLELALEAARARRPDRIVVVGGHGGRLDHLLGNALLLGAEALVDVEVDAYAGPASLHVVRGRRELSGAPGELLTLLALHGPAHGVTTEGLRYPLVDEDLAPGSSRGLSNRFVARRATVSVRSGMLLAVRPGDDAVPDPAGG